MAAAFLALNHFQDLLDLLSREGMSVLAPVVRNGAVVLDRVDSADQITAGVRDTQAAGYYRLRHEGEAMFSWATALQTLKPLVFAPEEPLWSSRRTGGSVDLEFAAVQPAAEQLAVIGVRACDLAALSVSDQHFGGPQADYHYGERRRRLFLIAINCSRPAATCFCHATGDGPEVRSGADLVLDEVSGGFVVRADSAPGSRILSLLALQPALPQHVAEAEKSIRCAEDELSRNHPGLSLRSAASLQQVAVSEHMQERCLACGNCTAVCPTCFCYREVDVVADDLSSSVRMRQWDSCFSEGHSYIHGIVIRSEVSWRYRQWLSHKFTYWYDQMGRGGCVGCGRCITWCPAGISILEELAGSARSEVSA